MSGADTSDGRRPNPRRIVVMRHGVTAYNAADIVQGQLDIPLSEQGRAQAAAAAPWVAQLAPSIVMSSDLSRAAHTAYAVGAHVGADVILDPRLRESASGSWEGHPVNQLNPVPDWATFGVGTPRGGDGESVLDVVARVRPLLADLTDALPEQQTALLVTHGVTARAIIAVLLGWDAQVAWASLGGLHNCAWAITELTHAGWRLRAWNLTAPEQVDLGLNADSG